MIKKIVVFHILALLAVIAYIGLFAFFADTNTTNMVFLSDKELVLGHFSGMVSVIQPNLTVSRQAKLHSAPVRRIAVNGYGNLIATADINGNIIVCDAKTLSLKQKYSISHRVSFLEFWDNDQALLVKTKTDNRGADDQLLLLNIQSGDKIPWRSSIDENEKFSAHYSVCVGFNGKHLLRFDNRFCSIESSNGVIWQKEGSEFQSEEIVNATIASCSPIIVIFFHRNSRSFNVTKNVIVLNYENNEVIFDSKFPDEFFGESNGKFGVLGDGELLLSPDGTVAYFAARSYRGLGAIFALSFQSGQVSCVVPDFDTYSHFFNLSLAPNGRMLKYHGISRYRMFAPNGKTFVVGFPPIQECCACPETLNKPEKLGLESENGMY